MYYKNVLLAAALAVSATAFATGATAAPLSSAAPSATAAASIDSAVQNVGWQRRRHCRRGHCHWRRVWVPGVSIYIGEGRRHRHGHRHYNRRHGH